MITPYQSHEERDPKADSFWHNLVAKLGVSVPLVRSASSTRPKLLSDAIQTHSGRRPESTRVAADAMISRVADQERVSARVADHLVRLRQEAMAELGQEDRVKVVDHLKRICDDAGVIRKEMDEIPGGDKNVQDLKGEIMAKADAVAGACTQLREKADQMSLAMAKAIENVFLTLSEAKTVLEEVEHGAEMPAGPEMMLMGDLPEAPMIPGEPLPGPGSEMMPLPLAGHVPDFMKKAQADLYENLRCVHMKLMLSASMLEEIVADLNVGAMLPSPEMSMAMPGPDAAVPTPSHPEPGGLMGPDVTQIGTPEAPVDAALIAKYRAKLSKFAASGDPGDMDTGNLVYKDISKCRDCVWFESDWTHETYRDKCKHCVFAKLNGTVNHFWPRSHQMIVWQPQWGAPEAAENKVRLSDAFDGSLSLRHLRVASVDPRVSEVASEIVSRADGDPVMAGTIFASLLENPVFAPLARASGKDIIGEIERVGGYEIAITAERARDWGWKNSLGDGEVAIAFIPEVLVQRAKGERQKIKDLRERLEKADDPGEIKSLSDAIDALEGRVEKDKERKEKRRQDREEKQKAKAEEAPAVSTATFRGSLCLADARDDNGADAGPKRGDDKPRRLKNFKVVAVSSNRNSFGLHGVVLLAEDGEAWEAAHAASPDLPRQGDTLQVDLDNWAASGFEIPRELPPPPPEVVEQVWGGEREAAFLGSLSLAQARGSL